jgi:arabinose-5-phosphate isomerase
MAKTVTSPAECVRAEASALLRLAERMEGAMRSSVDDAVARVAACAEAGGRVIAAGMGKSGHVARKWVATLNSLGVAAQFLHAAEAAHGDVGMVHAGDLVVAFSYSGETEELLRLVEVLKSRAAGLIAVCGCATSTLAKAADLVLDVSVDAEACAMNLAPTASTTAMLALGDALAIAVSERRGFGAEDFAALHPGGRLGRRLQKVSELMHAGEKMPRVSAGTLMPAVIHAMSEKRLGMTTIVDGEGRLLGVVSDGDLRRLIEREGGDALKRTAGEVMHRNPVTVSADEFAGVALEAMEARKITSIVAVEGGVAVGVVHLHDLWER